MNTRAFFPLVIAAGTLLGLPAAFAAGNHSGGHGASEIGAPAKATKATRTVNVVMKDNLYEPEVVSVRTGETIRFVIKNHGEFVHEFKIRTTEMHAAHTQEMMIMAEQGALETETN